MELGVVPFFPFLKLGGVRRAADEVDAQPCRPPPQEHRDAEDRRRSVAEPVVADRQKLIRGLVRNRTMLSLDNRPNFVHRSNMVRVMNSDVNRLMIRPDASNAESLQLLVADDVQRWREILVSARVDDRGQSAVVAVASHQDRRAVAPPRAGVIVNQHVRVDGHAEGHQSGQPGRVNVAFTRMNATVRSKLAIRAVLATTPAKSVVDAHEHQHRQERQPDGDRALPDRLGPKVASVVSLSWFGGRRQRPDRRTLTKC